MQRIILQNMSSSKWVATQKCTEPTPYNMIYSSHSEHIKQLYLYDSTSQFLATHNHQARSHYTHTLLIKPHMLLTVLH